MTDVIPPQEDISKSDRDPDFGSIGSRIRPTATRPVVSECVKRLYYEKRGIPIRGYTKGALEMRPYLKDGS